MRHLFAAILMVVGLAAVPAQAGFDESRAWFEALAPETRATTQTNLTLLGFYGYLVDGRFGNGTFQALTRFQRNQGLPATGVLSDDDLHQLTNLAADVYTGLGMDLVRDREGQAVLVMPVGLLTERHPIQRGNSYSTPDGGIALQTSRRPIGEKPFQALFDELRLPRDGRSVTYSHYSDDRFVISGKVGGRSFYTMFQNAGTDSVGYSLSWTADHDERASMLAVFIASHFTALRYTPVETGDNKLANTPSVLRQIGVFSLPSGALDVIILNGEITHTLEADFRLALEERPYAKVLVLNSPGGYVDNALQVAREVRRRGMSTLVGDGMGCYSACAYIFFGGRQRYVAGELGVHQISSEVADLVLTQTTLSDVLDTLDQFGVARSVASVMLRTPPSDMYVFSAAEIADLGINAGPPVTIEAMKSVEAALRDGDVRINPAVLAEPDDLGVPGAAHVQLSLQGSEAEAIRSLDYLLKRWGDVLGDAVPEIALDETDRGPIYRVQVPAISVENANALCAAIKSAGGGCYVTET